MPAFENTIQAQDFARNYELSVQRKEGTASKLLRGVVNNPGIVALLGLGVLAGAEYSGVGDDFLADNFGIGKVTVERYEDKDGDGNYEMVTYDVNMGLSSMDEALFGDAEFYGEGVEGKTNPLAVKIDGVDENGKAFTEYKTFAELKEQGDDTMWMRFNEWWDTSLVNDYLWQPLFGEEEQTGAPQAVEINLNTSEGVKTGIKDFYVPGGDVDQTKLDKLFEDFKNIAASKGVDNDINLNSIAEGTDTSNGNQDEGFDVDAGIIGPEHTPDSVQEMLHSMTPQQFIELQQKHPDFDLVGMLAQNMLEGVGNDLLLIAQALGLSTSGVVIDANNYGSYGTVNRFIDAIKTEISSK